MTIPVIPGNPPEAVVLDRPSRCPYLIGRTARMPLRLPIRELTRSELDQRLEAGDRRQGLVLYRTECPSCRACEPIRVDVPRFVPNRSFRRVKLRGDRLLKTELGPPIADARRLELYETHKRERGLADEATPIDAEDYRAFLVSTSCESFELRYYLGGDLVGVGITDRGETGLSAVYCFFDPRHERLSLGTYSILKQIELCARLGLRWLYLGLYIADSDHMRYKARFRPHERLIDGHWVRFD